MKTLFTLLTAIMLLAAPAVGYGDCCCQRRAKLASAENCEIAGTPLGTPQLRTQPRTPLGGCCQQRAKERALSSDCQSTCCQKKTIRSCCSKQSNSKRDKFQSNSICFFSSECCCFQGKSTPFAIFHSSDNQLEELNKIHQQIAFAISESGLLPYPSTVRFERELFPSDVSSVSRSLLYCVWLE